LANVIVNTYLGNIKMEIFILIGIVLVALVGLLWFRSNKDTAVKVESVVAEPAVATVEVKEEPVQEKVEQAVVIDEVVPEVVKPVKKPKAKKPIVAAQPATPKPKRVRKPKA
jgi:hypothetical protein